MMGCREGGEDPLGDYKIRLMFPKLCFAFSSSLYLFFFYTWGLSAAPSAPHMGLHLISFYGISLWHYFIYNIYIYYGFHFLFFFLIFFYLFIRLNWGERDGKWEQERPWERIKRGLLPWVWDVDRHMVPSCPFLLDFSPFIYQMKYPSPVFLIYVCTP